MFDWKFRFLLFADKWENPIQSSGYLLVRDGSYLREIDCRFSDLETGFEFVSGFKLLRELYIFKRGESIPLNSLKEIVAGINDGVKSMSEEKYWFAHEIFEDFWKHFKNEQREFFHGVVLLCISMVHFQMRHEPNAQRIFHEAKNMLQRFIGDSSEWDFSYPLDEDIIRVIRERSISLISH